MLWAAGIFAYLLYALVANLALRGPRPDPLTGLAFLLARVYARVRHRLVVVGREHAPTPGEGDVGPLIVVANHASGIDPIVAQVALPGIFVRWVMGADMRIRAVDWLWRFTDVIFVDRSGSADPAALKAMLAHLEAGGVLGVFPEGRLRQPGMPLGVFQAGVGLLVRRTGARVLPLVITGVPRTPKAWDALWRTSRTRVEIKPLIEFPRGMSATEIAAGLRARYGDWLSTTVA